MSLITPTEGATLALGYIVNKTSPANLTLHLYINNYTPIITTIASNFTECTTPGYVAIVLTGTSWTISTTSNITTASFATQTFTLTSTSSDTTVYGYYVTNGVTAWAERFPSPPIIPSSGGTINVTPSLNYGTC